MSVHEWRPAAFTSHFRRQDPEPPVARWEKLLRAEQSFTYRLLTLVARTPGLRRLVGIPAQFASATGSSLAAREARASAIVNTRLARGIERAVGRRRQKPAAGVRPESSLPPIGPLLNRDVDMALGLLTGMAFQELQFRGWHLQPNHYYWPLNDLEFLRGNPRLWADPQLPRGIDWDIEGQMELVQRLGRYADELADVREGPPERPGEFTWGQGFGGLDAYAYYGLLRDLKPARVVEVGIGVSSILLGRALAANKQTCDVTLIDPGPPWRILGEVPEDWRVHPSLVQHVDPAVFSSLQSGDVLFYDGSHCVRTGSDVNWMLFEILPRLQPGVWVHVHDMSWPRDYGEGWIFDEGLSWNEQYFMQAFLMHNTSYRVRLGSVLLHHYKGSVLEKLFPTDIGGASSLWIEKVS